MDAREPTVTTVVGGGAQQQSRNRPTAATPLKDPWGVAVLPDGSWVFAERGKHILCRYDPATGDFTTLAGTVGAQGFKDGPADDAQFDSPAGLVVDGNGNVLVADSNNNRIRCLDMTTKHVTTVAGTGEKGFRDGPAHVALFNWPMGVAVDADGNVLVADSFNHRIRCIDMTTKHVTTLTGTGESGFRDGPVARAQFNDPWHIAVDGNGNVLVVDRCNHRIRCLNRVTDQVTTVAGTGERGLRDGPADRAQFYFPHSLVVDGNGNVIVADTCNHTIRCIDMTTNHVSTLAGTGESGFQDGPAGRARFDYPTGVAVIADGSVLVVDRDNHRIRTISGVANIAPPLGRAATAFARAPPRGTFTERLTAHRARLGRAEVERARQQALLEAEDARAEAERAQLRAQFKVERARLQAKLEADITRVQKRCDRVAATFAAAVTACDDEATAVRELEVEAEGFRDLVATEGIDGLNAEGVHELLRLLEVTSVALQTLERQEITGAVLPHVSEGQMRDVFKMQRLGDRRRLSAALKRLANRQGFPPPLTAQPGALGWSAAEVGDWLRREEFPALVERFAGEGIDGPCLLGLRSDDLDALGESLTVGQSTRLRLRLEALKKITYAGQVVRGDGGGDAATAAGASDDAQADGAHGGIKAVLETVLQENEALQRRVAERAREPARAAAPPQFLCPILQDVMEDPVMAMDGHTYEREAIEAWFLQSDRSPMTNLPIPPVLVPNIVVRQLIAEHNS
jgi:DNA-binding beta-propeller fold protein YncE